MKSGHIAFLGIVLTAVALVGFRFAPVADAEDGFTITGGFSEGHYFSWRSENPAVCITEEQYKQIRSRIEENVAKLKSEGRLPQIIPDAVVTFRLPVFAPHLTDYGYYCITSYVDQDPNTGQKLDWNCGSRTYDGHRGTDFANWPFAWRKMDLSEVKVAAAAAGTIFDKHDGETDRCCTGDCNDGNYVIIEHIDGSRALYWHFKSGSVTAKAIGESVYKGEYLGIVGSSGHSTGPHLHFEVWDADYSLIDPYAGDCNYLNDDNWWDGFQSYYEHQILALMTHSQAPEYPLCPGQETPYATSLFHPGDQIVFSTHYRDLMGGDVTDFAVKRPGGTNQWSWSETAPTNYSCVSVWTDTINLPSDAPLGEWSYQAVYRGNTYVCRFYVDASPAPTTTRVYMESETAVIDGDENPSKSCHNSQEEIYQHITWAGADDLNKMTILSADMRAIPENAVITGVDAHIWAKRVANSRGGSFRIYVGSGANNNVICEQCMDYSQALNDCNIRGGNTEVFRDSNAGVGEYINFDMSTSPSFTNREAILERAREAYAHYNQYNHQLFFRIQIVVPSGQVDTYADGLIHGATALSQYRPYVDVTYDLLDTDPPVPEPMEWAAIPYPPVGSSTSLSMSGVEGSDDTPPIEYYFDCVSGGLGCDDRSWNTAREYTDDGLSPNTLYSYAVKARDSVSPPNTGDPSDSVSVCTGAETPPPPTVADPTESTVDVDPQCGGNPSYTELAIWNATSSYWVDASGGNAGSTPTWQTDAVWATVTVTGLTVSTKYCFGVVARNGDGEETVLSDTACVYTEPSSSVGRDSGPLQFMVSEGKPNPSSITTRITFEVPHAGHVSVTIYDVAGRPVARLLDSSVAAGRHDVVWDRRCDSGTEAAPGTYFCRIETKGDVAMRKIIAVR